MIAALALLPALALQEGYSFEEKRLAEIPEGCRLSWAYIIRGGRAAICGVATPEGRQFVLLDGVAGEKFNEITALNWSENGRRIVYLGEPEEGDSSGFLIEGDRRSAQIYPMRNPTFSPDGSIFACPLMDLASNGRMQSMMIEWESGKLYDEVGDPVFSSDGAVAYIAREGEKEFVVRERTEGERFDAVAELAFLGDGTPVFVATLGGKSGRTGGRVEGGACFVQAGEKAVAEFEAVEGLILNEARTRFAYVATQDGAQFVMDGDRPGPRYARIWRLKFSPDGKTVAYFARTGAGKWVCVLGETPGEEFEDISRPPMDSLYFSSDGGRVAYWANRGGKRNERGDLVGGTWHAVVGTEVGEPFDLPGWPIKFNAGGTVVAYCGNQGGTLDKFGWGEGGRFTLVVDGRSVRTAEKIAWLDFPPSGDLPAYSFREGEKFFTAYGERVVETRRMVHYRQFSADGRTMAYLVNSSDQSSGGVLHAGAWRSEPFDKLLEGPVFSSDGRRMAFAVASGREVWWKVVELE